MEVHFPIKLMASLLAKILTDFLSCKRQEGFINNHLKYTIAYMQTPCPQAAKT